PRPFPAMSDQISPDNLQPDLPAFPGQRPASVDSNLPEQLYQLLFNAVNDAIVLVDTETRTVVTVNDTFCQMTGFGHQEAKGLSLEVLFTDTPPSSRQEFQECICRAVTEGPQLFAWQARDRHGQRHWFELNLKALPLGRKTYILGTLRDIRVRREMEAKAQQHERATLALLHALKDVALLLDPNGVILAANQTARKCLQSAVPDCVGRNVFELLPPRVAASRRAQLEKVCRSGKTTFFEDENAGRYFLNMLYPIFNDQGQVSQLGIYALDVTEARKMQRELARTKGRLQCLLDHVPVALYGCHPEDVGRLTYLSKSIERLTGFTPEELMADPFCWIQRIHPEDRHLILTRRQNGNGGQSQVLEYRFRHKDGHYFWLHDEFTLVSDQNGQPLEYIGSLLGITATREAREKLARSEARYRAIVECQKDLICRFSPDTTLVYVNEAVCRFLQLPREALLGTPFALFLEAEDRQNLIPWLATFTPDQPVAHWEYKVMLPDGSRRWLSWMVYAFFDAEERLQEFQAVGRDITDRVAAEEALRQSEQRFRTYTENSLVGVLVLQEQRLCYANPALARMFGYEPAELIDSFDVMELVHPDYRDMLREKIRARLAGAPPERYTIQGRRRDGSVIYCELTGSRIDYQNRPAILVTVIDMTQRWQAEAALRASEEKFRLLVEKMNDGLGICDAAQRIIYVNPRFCELVGYPEEELLGRPLTDILDEANQQVFAEQFARRRQGEETPYQLTWTMKDGNQLTKLISPRPLFDKNGRFQGSFAILTDITFYQKAEAALQRREQYFRQLTENVSDVIGLLTADGLIKYLNPTVARLLGFTPQDLIGTSFFALVHPAEVDTLRRRFQRLLQQAAEDFSAVVQVRHQNGTWHLWQIKGRNLLAEPVVAGIVINAQDITEQKNLEEALQQSAKKLRALTAQIFAAQETERRRLSLELHDELGQSLTALKLQLRAIANQLRKDQTKLREECSQVLAYINGVVENVRRLSHDLCPSLLENVGLGAALRHLLENFRQFYQINDNLQELDEIEATLPAVAKIHLYRIFQELLTNIDKHAHANAICVEVQRLKNHLAVTVADNGRGFPLGAGEAKTVQTGLGLPAISERILMLGGTLDIQNQAQGGTRIYF
ncbi:MAG: sensor histidine kinase, partial [Desulfobacca sp.]|uniref:sensor histidine kinase n=1 Tax=Desulfobacca sp. TaxID=2067990 RepID=UPI0040499180